MAQRTIHYAFGELFSRQIRLRDKNRFLLGSIMPDAYADPRDRDRTHYKIKTATHVYLDFCAFRNQFSEEILQDDLYLGYYMHLVEDAFYRQFLYSGHFKATHNRAEVARLHNDYHILNAHIVNKYGIRNELQAPFDLTQEPINRIAAFRIHEFIQEMAWDFTEQPTGATFYISEDMVDAFMDKYVPLGLEELRHIQNGESVLRASDYTWRINE